MKIKTAINLPKYKTENFNLFKNLIFHKLDTNTYCITLYCELEENEDTQFPLEYLLEDYNVSCTDYMENCLINSKNIYIFELEGDIKDIEKISLLVGKEYC